VNDLAVSVPASKRTPIEASDPAELRLAVLALLIVYTALAAAYLLRHETVRNLDFWYHIELGQRLDPSALSTFVNGFYPLGYPLLLSKAIAIGLDALRVGQALSWLGGLLALISVAAMTARLAGSTAGALAAGILLISNVTFLDLSTREGTDMLASGLQLACVACLVWYSYAPDRRRGFALVGAAGIALGLAYMVRYTALVVLACALVYLLLPLLTSRSSQRSVGLASGLFLGGFALATFPQLAASTIVHHQPFFNLQAKNVWFGIYGGWDWVNNWPTVSDSISLAEVISLDPARFGQHWLAELTAGLTTLSIWSPPVHIAWMVGMAAIVLDRRIGGSARLLFVSVLLASITAAAMAWLTPRFMLVAICLQAVAAAVLLDRVATLTMGSARLRLGATLAAAVILCATFQMWETGHWLTSPPDSKPHQVHQLLRLAGMKEVSSVATNDPYLHATDLAARTSYPQLSSVMPKPASIDSLLDHPAAARWQYLVLNFETGFGDYSAIRDQAAGPGSRLVTLANDPSATIYCVKPCAISGVHRADMRFLSGAAHSDP
jgi:hypothetical protein